MKYRGHTSLCTIAFCLVLCAVANDAQADWGLRVGGLHAATELDDSPGYGLSAFICPSLSPRYRVEFNAGYGRLRGADYATDLASGEGRLLYALGHGRYWSAHLYGGAGLLRFNLATSPPETTPDAAAIGWAAIAPIGIGFKRPLGPNTGLDLHFGYTYSLRDDLNRAILQKGNDSIWTLSIGLVFGAVGYRPPLRQLPLQTIQRPTAPVQRLPPIAVTDEPDRDGDGLTDREETLYYYTNPVMADSDSDGLNDLEEVKVYGTDPNRFDSDSGGVRDGEEIARGADPLDPGDDFVPDKLLEEEPQPVATSINRPMPSVFFPAGGVVLIPEARENLDLVVNYMRQHPDIALELHGHSDSVGSRTLNLQLSRQRAEAVQAYLTALGIETRRLKIRALGESHPIASNATQTGRLKNRRVELILAPR